MKKFQYANHLTQIRRSTLEFRKEQLYSDHRALIESHTLNPHRVLFVKPAEDSPADVVGYVLNEDGRHYSIEKHSHALELTQQNYRLADLHDDFPVLGTALSVCESLLESIDINSH